MNSQPNIIYALGCARGAAMAALCPADLDTLTDDQIVARMLPVMGRAPMATESQLAEWLADDDGGMVLDGLDGFRWWRKRRRRAPVAVVTPAPAANWATLHGLDALDGSKKWKKRLKRLGKNLKKVAQVAVMTTQGGVKGIKKQVRIARENPKAFLTAAVSLATGNPAGLAKAAQQYSQDRAARKAGAAEPEAPMTDPETRYEQAYAAPAARSYAAYAPEPVYGQVTRLPQEEEKPRVVGLNWGGIADSIKANPVPWAVGAGVGLYLITRRT